MEQAPGSSLQLALRELQRKRVDVKLWRGECERLLEVIEKLKADTDEAVAGLDETLRDLFWTDRSHYRWILEETGKPLDRDSA